MSRSLDIAVVGRPNAGKSTLVNRLVGEHVGIVSPIAQTTRRPVRGILRHEDVELVFLDLPGSQGPRDALTRRMQGAVEGAVGDCDVVLWVVDASVEPAAGEARVAEIVTSSGAQLVVALNKIDRMKPAALLKRISQLSGLIGDSDYNALVPVSAVSGDGLDVLVDEIAKCEGSAGTFFPEGEKTDLRFEERCAEIIRESTLDYLKEELPHATIATVEEIEMRGGILHIDAVIWVERESQKGIVVGKGGENIKAAGIRSRKILEEIAGSQIDLRIRVKTRKSWRGDDRWLEGRGL